MSPNRDRAVDRGFRPVPVSADSWRLATSRSRLAVHGAAGARSGFACETVSRRLSRSRVRENPSVPTTIKVTMPGGAEPDLVETLRHMIGATPPVLVDRVLPCGDPAPHDRGDPPGACRPGPAVLSRGARSRPADAAARRAPVAEAARRAPAASADPAAGSRTGPGKGPVRSGCSDGRRRGRDQRQLFLPVAEAAIGRSREHPRGV